MCEGRLITKEDRIWNTPTRTQLNDLIDKATVPDDILLAWAEHRGNADQAANALIKWTSLMFRINGKFEDQQEKVSKDLRVQDMMNTVSQEVRKTDIQME